ncbi:redoxin domain-containing protein [Cohnella boryungensis]|uniref:TlpA family protein disulfide reductase n=1 Tax=Cohnella boryungensis TaxID=768479 RepID=A0ABV8SAR6_9BACL
MKREGHSFKRRLTAFLVVLALAGLISVLATTLLSDRDTRSDGFALGEEAPPIQGVDTAGQRIALQDYRGQAVVVNFWASWCKPCVQEMPLIDEAYREGKFKLISVNAGESKGTVNEYLREHGISFPVLIDATGQASDRYRVVGLPATFVIDEQGRLSRMGVGELTDREQLDALLSGAGEES